MKLAPRAAGLYRGTPVGPIEGGAVSERPTNMTTTAAHVAIADGVACAETVTGGGIASTSSMAVPAAAKEFVAAAGLAVYDILEPLRKFEHGTVYLARHKTLDRRVALRVLENDAALDPKVRDAFIGAANSCAAISHPNLATILEASDGDPPFVAEEYFEGKPIAGFGPRSPVEEAAEFTFPNRELAGLLQQAAVGLHFLHQHGAFAGPLSMDRVVVNERGQVKLVGLGEMTATDSFETSQSAQERIRAEVLSLCAVGRQIAAGGAHQRSASVPIRQLNPGISKGLAAVLDLPLSASHPTITAETLCGMLDKVQRRHFIPIGWWPRTISLAMDALLVLPLFGILVAIAMTTKVIPTAQNEFWIMLGCAALAASTLPACELAVGWTPGRRFYACTIVDRSGERPAWGRWALRQVGRAGWLTLLAIMGYEVFVGAFGPQPSIAFFMPLLTAPVAALSLYACSGLSKSRMPPQDILSGVRLARLDDSLDAYDPDMASSATISLPSTFEELPEGTEPLERVDQYDLYEVVGAGGMGQVYRARDSVLGRVVAFKVMTSRSLTDDTEIQRFEREARLAASLSHPNIAKAFGFGRWGTQPYVAIEYVDGLSLQQLLKANGRLPLAKAWNYIEQAALGLKEADRAGVVHRDVKPSNLIVDRKGTLKVVDFGVARKTVADEGLTRTGTFVGTPKFMSPEQATGKELDCRADIYSLGMTLYTILTGAPPFDKGNPMEILAQQLSEDPPSLLGKVQGLTEERNAILCKMLAKKREDRYASYNELLAALHRESPNNVRIAKPVMRFKAEIQNWMLYGFVQFLFLVCALEALTLFLPAGNPTVVQARFEIYRTLAKWGAFAITLAACLYYVVAMARWGRTFGKWAVGVRVLRTDGRRAGWRRSLGRLALLYPSLLVALPGSVIPALGQAQFAGLRVVVWAVLGNLVWLVCTAASAWRNPRCQMLHDKLLDTIVVETPRIKVANTRAGRTN